MRRALLARRAVAPSSAKTKWRAVAHLQIDRGEGCAQAMVRPVLVYCLRSGQSMRSGADPRKWHVLLHGEPGVHPHGEIVRNIGTERERRIRSHEEEYYTDQMEIMDCGSGSGSVSVGNGGDRVGATA